MTLTRPLALIAAFALAGCITPPAPRAASGQIMVQSQPSGATLTFLDGTTCETPCSVLVQEPLDLTVAKAGFKPVRTRLMPNDRGPLSVTLEPVGRRAPMEVFELPVDG